MATPKAPHDLRPLEPSASRRAEAAEQIEACIVALARLGVELRRGSDEPDAAETVREVATLLGKHLAEEDEAEWTDAAPRAVAAIYKDVRDGKGPATDDEYEQRLRAALAPLEPLPLELEELTLNRDEIMADNVKPEARLARWPDRPPYKGGPLEAARYALAPYLDDMLARLRGQPEPGGVEASKIRRRAKSHVGPVVTDADAREYLAELSLDDVERARRR